MCLLTFVNSQEGLVFFLSLYIHPSPTTQSSLGKWSLFLPVLRSERPVHFDPRSLPSFPLSLLTLTPRGQQHFRKYIDYPYSAADMCQLVPARGESMSVCTVYVSAWEKECATERDKELLERRTEHWICIDWLLGCLTWEWVNSFLSPGAVFFSFRGELQQYEYVSFLWR